MNRADVDAVVIGAGFAGLYALYKLREAGFRVRVFEKGDGVGGTWFWNRYPGARVDIQSCEYMFTKFAEIEQEWDWTELMPAQEEIERYLNFVADRLELRRERRRLLPMRHARILRRLAVRHRRDRVGDAGVPQEPPLRVMHQVAVIDEGHRLANVHPRRPARDVARDALAAVEDVELFDARRRCGLTGECAQRGYAERGSDQSNLFHDANPWLPAGRCAGQLIGTPGV
jgi:phytoene dehydrogenase-like protein